MAETIRTADGVVLALGQPAWNYYDGKHGVIGHDLDAEGWMTFHHDDGTSAVLNGERIAAECPSWLRGA